jgi:hypothetical protein
VLSKLGPEYSVFVSSFYTTKLSMGKTWKTPSMDDFIESLIHEQNKLIQLGALKSSKAHALATQETSKNKRRKERVRRNQTTRKKENKTPLRRPQVPREESPRKRGLSVLTTTKDSIPRMHV